MYDVEEYCLNFVAPTRYEVSSMGCRRARPCQGGLSKGGPLSAFPDLELDTKG